MLVPGPVFVTCCLADCIGWCVSVQMGFASSIACMMDALSVGMRSDQSELPEEVQPIEKFV